MKIKNKPFCINGLMEDATTVKETIYMVFSYYDINFCDVTLPELNSLVQFSVKNISYSSYYLAFNTYENAYSHYYVDKISMTLNKINQKEAAEHAQHLINPTHNSLNISRISNCLVFISENWKFLKNEQYTYHFIAFLVSRLKFNNDKRTRLELTKIFKELF
ncbi:hypothetical protein [Acetobacterium wieringae]|uniref:hypothetical protein n=1 Tax=Acetobacterium wieringae TaxID=52694 RepID=UPI002B1EA324|nr:hypothetical protein [Acetobacterium wieringae]MEA4805366.1 hypothetical protein [Acetobacterium wieringae]